jgi:hypothetical protein
MDNMLNEEVGMIKKSLNENIEGNIENYKHFHIGEFVEVPNQCGCFKRKSSWYTYEIDEKNFCTFSGPFSLKAIIYACSKLLHLSKNLKENKFSEEELEVYINNNFHSFNEIDSYIK